MVAISGGDKFEARLRKIAERLASGKSLRVGFLEGTTYDDGTSVPMVATVNEFGGKINVPAHETTIYRKTNKDGSFAKGGKFVKRKASNFASDHQVPAHTITIPARPFMRPTVAAHEQEWADAIAPLLKNANYDAAKALGQLGLVIHGNIVDSIQAVTSPPLAPSTVRRKGFDKPLIDTSVMWKSIREQVDT